MSQKLISSTLSLLLLLAITATAFAQQRRNFQSQASSNRAAAQAPTASQSDAAVAFRSARDLITDGQWARAQEKFSDYVSSYPNEKNLDAALYWMAYAQQK